MLEWYGGGAVPPTVTFAVGFFTLHSSFFTLHFFTFLLFNLFTFKLPNRDCRHEGGRIGFGGDVVLLLLSLVLAYHESCGAGAGKEGDDGGAHCHYEVADK